MKQFKEKFVEMFKFTMKLSVLFLFILITLLTFIYFVNAWSENSKKEGEVTIDNFNNESSWKGNKSSLESSLINKNLSQEYINTESERLNKYLWNFFSESSSQFNINTESSSMGENLNQETTESTQEHEIEIKSSTKSLLIKSAPTQSSLVTQSTSFEPENSTNFQSPIDSNVHKFHTTFDTTSKKKLENSDDYDDDEEPLTLSESKQDIQSTRSSVIPSEHDSSFITHRNFKIFDDVPKIFVKSTGKIQNGMKAGIESLPWVAAIFLMPLSVNSTKNRTLSSIKFLHCSGSLITENLIVSAAHCVPNKFRNDFKM